MRTFYFIGVAAIPVLLSGCNDNSKTAALELRIAELEKKVISVEESTAGFAIDLFLKADAPGLAYLTPGSDGYSTVRFDLGVLTVGIKDIQPYANGSKLLLQIGNPLAVVVNGLQLDIDWGEVIQGKGADNENAKHKTHQLLESLQPNSWNHASIILDGIPPNKLGFVRIKNVTHRGIRLTAAR